MHFHGLAGLVAVGLALAPGAWAQTLQDVREPETPLVLRAQGSFFVGGDHAEVKAAGWKALNLADFTYQIGEVVSRQMYVQFQRPDTREAHIPVVFVHGCCPTSKTWETTPDGRMGWYEYFTRKGHATYLADQVGRGRSALDASIFNEVREGLTPATELAPVFVATREMMWNVFRLGPKVGEAWPDEKFPMSRVEELQKQLVPDFLSYYDRDWIGNFNNGAAANPTVQRLASLAALLHGAVLVGHSQSSPYPTQAALLQRGGVKGIVGIETGCFSALTLAQIQVLVKVPILIIVGDHLGEPKGQQGPCDIEKKAINDAGGDFTYAALPDLGIHGNSHMLMQDTNNLQIADIVLAWIRDHVETKRPTGSVGPDGQKIASRASQR